MVVALVVLGLAMVAGGVASVLFGWEIVLLERGWTMVISGTVAAAGGAVLFGLAAVVARLGKVRSELSLIRERLDRREVDFAPPVESAVPAVAPLPMGGEAAPFDLALPPLPEFMRPAVDTQEPPLPVAEVPASLDEDNELLVPLGEETKPREPRAPGSPPPTIVGTYKSGDNRYVMYADGSIEADTPQGVFHFDSLDELKDFIASAGEEPPVTT